MRLLLIGATAAFLLVPAITPAKACEGASLTLAQVGTVDLAAAKDALTNDLAAAKKKKEKVEYMRSAAGPEPAMQDQKANKKHMKKHRKHRKHMKKKKAM